MAQGLECQVAIVHRDTQEGDDKKNPKGFVLSGKAPEAGADASSAARGGEAAAPENGEGVELLSDSDDPEVVDAEPADSRKRDKRGNGAAPSSSVDSQPAKRRRA